MSSDTPSASDSFQSGSDAQKHQILNKKFKILGSIHSEGIRAYKAVDLQSGATVDIKILPGCLDNKSLDDVRLKARLSFNLSHPNIAQTHNLESDGTQQYFVTEYVDGMNLEQRIFSQGVISVAEVVEIFGQVAKALDYAHRQHVFHGDLKLSNIILTKDGKAKLADFGIAGAVEAAKICASGQKVIEVPYYRAPERVRGTQPESLSDIYSFATVIYECFCGHPPFWGSSIEQQILNDQPAPLEVLNDKQNAAILKALSKSAHDRQRTATELIKQLAEGQAKQHKQTSATKRRKKPSNLTETSSLEKNGHGNKRKRSLVLVVPFVAIALTIGIGVVIGQLSHKSHERELAATRLWRQAQFQELKQRGISLENDGKWQEAIDSYDKALVINADDNDLKERLDICRHNLYAEQGEDAKHASNLAKVVDSRPPNVQSDHLSQNTQSAQQQPQITESLQPSTSVAPVTVPVSETDIAEKQIELEAFQRVLDRNARLTQAAEKGVLQDVQTLLADGAEINAKDNNDLTALMMAALNGHTEVVEILLEKGADVNTKDKRGWTALMISMFPDNTKVVKLLLEKGADVNVNDYHKGVTALHIAALFGKTEIVKLLIEKGADINAKTTDGSTALTLAGMNGYTEIVQMLEKAGAKKNSSLKKKI